MENEGNATQPASEGDESTAMIHSAEMRHNPNAKKHSHEKKKNSLMAPSIMIGLTFAFFVIELAFGFINGSIALLADAYHMLSDVFALTIAMFCLWIAKRSSKSSTFGWVRAEVIGALFNGVWLLTMCYTIALESIGRLLEPRGIANPLQVLIVGSIGLVINLIGMIVFHRAGMGHGGEGGHGHSHGKGGDKHENDHSHDDDGHSHAHEEKVVTAARSSRTDSQLSHENLALRMVNLEMNEAQIPMHDEEQPKIEDKKNLNMEGAFLHILTDFVGSIIIILTAGIALLWPDLMGGYFTLYLDPVLSLCLVFGMSYNAIKLVNQTLEVFLRLRPSFIDQTRLTESIEAVEGVVKVININTWTLVANRHLSTADIQFDSAADFASAVPAIRKVSHRHGIHSLTIQPIFTTAVELE